MWPLIQSGVKATTGSQGRNRKSDIAVTLESGWESGIDF
jgi:hypothetical protein